MLLVEEDLGHGEREVENTVVENLVVGVAADAALLCDVRMLRQIYDGPMVMWRILLQGK